jgi:hypothetical protein
MSAFKGSDEIIRPQLGRMLQARDAQGRRQNPKTPVEQALMRGLDTA